MAALCIRGCRRPARYLRAWLWRLHMAAALAMLPDAHAEMRLQFRAICDPFRSGEIAPPSFTLTSAVSITSRSTTGTATRSAADTAGAWTFCAISDSTPTAISSATGRVSGDGMAASPRCAMRRGGSSSTQRRRGNSAGRQRPAGIRSNRGDRRSASGTCRAQKPISEPNCKAFSSNRANDSFRPGDGEHRREAGNGESEGAVMKTRRKT